MVAGVRFLNNLSPSCIVKLKSIKLTGHEFYNGTGGTGCQGLTRQPIVGSSFFWLLLIINTHICVISGAERVASHAQSWLRFYAG